MVWADLASRFFSDIAQRRHEEDAAQARQQQANEFAIAWNRGVLAVPSSLVWSMASADGSTAPVWPGCAASISDDALMLLTFTVPPDGAVTADDVARQSDAVRRAARQFFGVRLRVTGIEAVAGRCSLMLAPVVPMLDAAGNFLAGFDDRREPVWVPLLGQVTSIASDDGAVSWISACISGVLPVVSAEPAAAVSDAARVGRVARKTGQPPAPMLVDLGDAVAVERPIIAEMLGFARRALVEWSTAQVEASAWAVRPTQVITRIGDDYVIERDGRKTPFTPAWLY